MVGPARDVLAGGFFHEALGRDHLQVFAFGVAEHPVDAAEVVDVAVGEDDCRDLLIAQLLAGEGQCVAGGRGGGQRVHQNPAGLALDQRDVGQVETAKLVDPLGHLEQAVDVVQLGLPPQAGIDAVRGVALDEGIVLHVPQDPAIGIGDLERFLAGNQAAAGVLEVLLVAERQ
jgi:hypothetical protein